MIQCCPINLYDIVFSAGLSSVHSQKEEGRGKTDVRLRQGVEIGKLRGENLGFLSI